jgi:ABC-type branched-subunit amino acid transport system ATPase component
MADILVIDKLTKWFGNLAAVNDLSFNVQQGEILGMMGPNGAGKTTVLISSPASMPPQRGESPIRAGTSPISRRRTDADWGSAVRTRFHVHSKT